MTTQNLKRIRTTILKITQNEMANRLGVSLRTYCRYEKRGAPPMALKLAATLVSDANIKADQHDRKGAA